MEGHTLPVERVHGRAEAGSTGAAWWHQLGCFHPHSLVVPVLEGRPVAHLGVVISASSAGLCAGGLHMALLDGTGASSPVMPLPPQQPKLGAWKVCMATL